MLIESARVSFSEVNHKSNPDFTNDELDIIKKTIAERFGEYIEVELADTEMRLDKTATQLTTCPAMYR